MGTTIDADGTLPNPDLTVLLGLVGGPRELPAVKVRLLASTADDLGRALLALRDIRRDLARLDLADGLQPFDQHEWLTELGHGLREIARNASTSSPERAETTGTASRGGKDSRTG